MKRMYKLLMALFIGVMSITMFGVAPLLEEDFENNVELGKIVGSDYRYIDGIGGGQAIALKGAEVRFSAPKMMSAKKGTVLLWIKAMNWKWDKEKFIYFFSWNLPDGKGNFNLYKYYNSKLGVLFYYGIPAGSHGVTKTYATMKTDTLESECWYQLGITWDQGVQLLEIYLDGQKVTSAKITADMFPAQEATEFVLNQLVGGKYGDNALETAFDKLSIYGEVLDAKAITRVYHESKMIRPKADNRKLGDSFAVLPYLSNPPNIDGNFGDIEWKGSMRLTGFSALDGSGVFLNNETTVYGGYDDHNIYFAYISKMPSTTKLVAQHYKRDAPIYADDSIELFLTPPQLENKYYQGIFNLNGAIYDAFTGNAKWNGDWQVKTGIYEAQWVTEIAIPIKQFNTVIKSGDKWGINFCRSWQNNKPVTLTSWSPTVKSYFNRFGSISFSNNTPYARLFVDYEKLFRRNLDFKLEITNLGQVATPVKLSVELLDANLKQLDKRASSAIIAPGSEHIFAYDNPLAGLRSGIVRINAITDKGEMIYNQDLPLVFSDSLTVLLNPNISQNTLDVEVDCAASYVTVATTNVEGRLLFNGAQIGDILAFKELPLAKGSFNLRDANPGDYQLELKFFDGSGRLLHSVLEPYNHIGQPKWLQEKPGLSGIPYPYLPINYYDNGDIGVWGRDLKFGKSLLPEQIISQKRNIFASAPQLIAKIAGKEIVCDNFTFQLTAKTAEKAELKFTANSDQLILQGTLHIEYDGMMWYEFNLSSTTEDLKIDELTLLMPLSPDVANFCNAHLFIRDAVAGKLKLPLDLKRYPTVWIGDLDVGLNFFTESFQNWHQSKPGQTYTLRKEENAVNWRVHLIDHKILLPKDGLNYQFGLSATPVKEIPPWFRSWRVSAHSNYNIAHPWAINRKIKKYSGDGGFFTPLHTSVKDFREEMEKWYSKGAVMPLYLNPSLVSTDSTEYKIFQKEWNNPYNPYPLCPNSNFTDFTVYHVAELIKDAKLQSVYVDSCAAYNCANPAHGCGYRDEKGGVHLTYPIRAMRNYLKRIYTLLHAEGRDQKNNILWAHMSLRTCAPIYAFLDIQVSGEEMEHKIAADSNYLNLYTPDEYQVYYMNTYGTPGMLLPNLGRVGKKEQRLVRNNNEQFLMLVLLHDSLLWNLWCDSTFVNRIYRILDDFGIKNTDILFNSYWKQRFITSSIPDIRISTYQLADRVLAVVGNFQDINCDIPLEINPQTLGFSKISRIVELREQKELSILTPSIKVGPRNFALIEIQLK